MGQETDMTAPLFIMFSVWRKDLREIGWESVNWMHLTQDRDQWWALVNMVMNLRIP
jgi:hypothetical protein